MMATKNGFCTEIFSDRKNIKAQAKTIHDIYFKNLLKSLLGPTIQIIFTVPLAFQNRNAGIALMGC